MICKAAKLVKGVGRGANPNQRVLLSTPCSRVAGSHQDGQKRISRRGFIWLSSTAHQVAGATLLCIPGPTTASISTP
ncbi:hypothetical protein CBOM_07851 [Ceraceosorus bombacis]|uniref:Uncharacterized protein n=1 Tax=Ceraceosorus bombacis TaxID=401625 RepID=A0A0P1BNZ4_9BASI|nr:hypothetical protein CBOM_07851 [Ceraceosorus bombacis]